MGQTNHTVRRRAKLLKSGLRLSLPTSPLEFKRKGHDGQNQGTRFPRRPCQHRCRARGSAPTKTGDDKQQVGTRTNLLELFVFLLGGCPSQIGVSTGPESTHHVEAKEHPVLKSRMSERPCIGMKRLELELPEVALGHVTGGIDPRPAQANHLNRKIPGFFIRARLKFL